MTGPLLQRSSNAKQEETGNTDSDLTSLEDSPPPRPPAVERSVEDTCSRKRRRLLASRTPAEFEVRTMTSSLIDVLTGFHSRHATTCLSHSLCQRRPSWRYQTPMAMRWTRRTLLAIVNSLSRTQHPAHARCSLASSALPRNSSRTSTSTCLLMLRLSHSAILERRETCIPCATGRQWISCLPLRRRCPNCYISSVMNYPGASRPCLPMAVL